MAKKMKFEKKLIAIYAITVLICSTLFLSVSYGYFNKNMLQNIHQINYEQAATYSKQLDNELDKLRNLMLQLRFNSHLSEYLIHAFYSNDSQTYLEKQIYEIEYILSEYMVASNAHIKRLAVYTKQGVCAVVGAQYSDDLCNQDIQKKIKEIETNRQDITSSLIHSFIEEKDPWLLSETLKPIYRIIVPIENQSNTQLIQSYGYAELQIEISEICQIFSPYINNNFEYQLLSSKNQILFSTEKDQLMETVSYKFLNQEISQFGEGEKYYYWAKSKMEPLTFLMILPFGTVYEPIQTITYMLLACYLLIIISSILIIRCLVMKITTPLRKLSEKMDQVTITQLDSAPKSSGNNDVINRLYHSYDQMMLRMESSKQQLIEAQTRELRTMYEALQSQINPHFLCNTLSMIAMLAYEKGEKQIYDIGMKLSAMFRYTIWSDCTPVRLKDELEYTKCYLQIMQMRYEGRLQVYIDCPDSFMELEVPKLIIQPLIENSIRHGFADKRCDWNIWIKIYFENSCVNISVKDNGSGFSPEMLKNIQEEIERIRNTPLCNYSNKFRKVGVLNTFLRLRIMYDNQTDITIHSTNDGSEIILSIFLKSNNE